jgi:hypothetical protein
MSPTLFSHVCSDSNDSIKLHQSSLASPHDFISLNKEPGISVGSSLISELGLYRAIADGEFVTPQALAEKTGNDLNLSQVFAIELKSTSLLKIRHFALPRFRAW